MSRFKQEYDGQFGEFWQKKAHEEVEKLLKDVEIDEDGAARWKSNGGYLMEDAVEKLLVAGINWFDPELTKSKRQMQVKEILAKVRKKRRKPLTEEMYEMRAAFGSGTTVVNVITGERIKL